MLFYLSMLEAERCLTLARSSGDTADEAYALHAIGRTCFEEEQYDRAAEFHAQALDIARGTASPQEIVLPRSGLEDVRVPLDSEGNFDLADFFGDQLPPAVAHSDHWRSCPALS